MKALYAALLLAASSLTAAQVRPISPQNEALMALARVHGVVRYFHPSDAVETLAWDRFLVLAAERMGTVEKVEEIGPRLESLYAPIVEGFKVVPTGTAAAPIAGEGPRVEWRHLGYGVESDANSPYVSWRTQHDPLANGKVKGGYFQNKAASEQVMATEPIERVRVTAGFEALVPISLPSSAAKVGAAQRARLDELAATLAKVSLAGEPVTRAQARADGIAAWNVARHFYPFGSLVKDWEGMLAPWLARQPAAQSRVELRDQLRRLMAPLQDGHVAVGDPKDPSKRGFLPISVRPVGMQWVVDASAVPDKVRAGDIITEVQGKSAARWFEEKGELISGTPQFRRWRLRFEFTAGPAETRISFKVQRGAQLLPVVLSYTAPGPMQGPRPAPIAEVQPAIYYVDITRFDKAAFDKALPALKDAKGIVFDLRGYPQGEAFRLASFWLKGEDKAQWMFVPRYDRPYAVSTTSWSNGWQVARNAMLEKPAKALLVDGRAFGYSESLAAYFPAQKAGPVVGEATAGATGNVARAMLPSGIAFFFSSMVETRHDSPAMLHGQGVVPDVAAEPTVEGIRAGRDEVLERAITLVRGS